MQSICEVGFLFIFQNRAFLHFRFHPLQHRHHYDLTLINQKSRHRFRYRYQLNNFLLANLPTYSVLLLFYRNVLFLTADIYLLWFFIFTTTTMRKYYSEISSRVKFVYTLPFTSRAMSRCVLYR